MALDVFRYVSTGAAMDFLNDTLDMGAGEVVVKNLLTGVTSRPVVNGAYGSLVMTPAPVFEGPLDSAAVANYAVGEKVYFNSATGFCQKTAPGQGMLVGLAVTGGSGKVGGIASASGAAAAGDSFVRFRLKTEADEIA